MPCTNAPFPAQLQLISRAMEIFSPDDVELHRWPSKHIHERKKPSSEAWKFLCPLPAMHPVASACKPKNQQPAQNLLENGAFRFLLGCGRARVENGPVKVVQHVIPVLSAVCLT